MASDPLHPGLFGTPTLRRHARKESIHLCLSLLLTPPDSGLLVRQNSKGERASLDVEAMSEADYGLLLQGFTALVEVNRRHAIAQGREREEQAAPSPRSGGQRAGEGGARGSSLAVQGRDVQG